MISSISLLSALVQIMLISSSRAKDRKGFTLIEVVCSIAVFFLFACAISSILKSITINRSYYNKTNKYVHCLEAAKNKICCSCDDEKIIKIAEKHNYFVNKDDISINIIKTKSIDELFNSARIPGFPYIEVNITDGEVFHFNLILHFINNGREQLINYSFVKGKY